MRIIVVIIISLWLSTPALAAPISYQGQLRQQDQPFSGTANLEFRLFTAASGGSQVGPVQTRNGVSVQEGLFQVELDFGAGAFDGSLRFLEVRVNGTAMSPRQAVSFAPQATIASTTVAGAIGSSQINPVQVQQRVTGTCPVGQYVRSVNQNGTVVCGADDAGWGLAGNAGTNPNNQFVGTTDGQPLVLRSTAGVGINTAGVRGMLTVRGPDDFEAGPVLHLSGNSPSQFESGRIRFVNGTAAGNYRGFYLHYDGAGNFFHIGGRDSTNQDPAEDRNIITIRRSLPNRVGIGTSTPARTLDVAGTARATEVTANSIGVGTEAPSEALDVVGNIGVTGGIKFGGTAHYLSFHGQGFSELAGATANQTTCTYTANGITKIILSLNDCRAHHNVHLPQGARIRQIVVRATDNNDETSCGVHLRRANILSGSAATSLIGSAFTTVPFNGGLTTVSSPQLSHTVNNEAQSLFLMVEAGQGCTMHSVRLEYELPNGFRP